MTKRLSVGVAIATAVTAADLLTKRYAAEQFAGHPVRVIGDFFGFTFVENTGGAFSLFPNGGQVIGIAALLVTALVVAALLKPRARMELIALGLVLGGALGNLIDRIARGDGFLDGPVIDWIILSVIPTFNIADASVTMAVVLLLIHSWQTR